MEFTIVRPVVRNMDEGDVFVVQSKAGEQYIWCESNRVRDEQEIQQDLNAAELWKELGDRSSPTDMKYLMKYTPVLKSVGVGLKKGIWLFKCITHVKALLLNFSSIVNIHHLLSMN